MSIGEKGKRRKSDISTRATPGEIFGEDPNPKIQVDGQSYVTLHEWFPWLPGEHFCPRLDLSPNLNSHDICEGDMSPTREIMMLDWSKKERKKAASSDVVRAAISTI